MGMSVGSFVGYGINLAHGYDNFVDVVSNRFGIDKDDDPRWNFEEYLAEHHPNLTLEDSYFYDYTGDIFVLHKDTVQRSWDTETIRFFTAYAALKATEAMNDLIVFEKDFGYHVDFGWYFGSYVCQ